MNKIDKLLFNNPNIYFSFLGFSAFSAIIYRSIQKPPYSGSGGKSEYTIPKRDHRHHYYNVLENGKLVQRKELIVRPVRYDRRRTKNTGIGRLRKKKI